MILPNEKLIYIHVPKTGGASVEDYLLDNFNQERSVLSLTGGIGLLKIKNKVNDGWEAMYPYMHYTLPQIVKEASKVNIKVDNSWSIFSIVRNPYYKFLSEIFFVSPSLPLQHYHTLPNKIDKDILINESIDSYFTMKQNERFHSNHSLPQYKFFEDTDLNCKIFKFEEGLINIMGKLGFDAKDNFPHRLNMFHISGSPRPNYKDVLTPHLIEVVNKRYQKDFETFKYNMLSPLDI